MALTHCMPFKPHLPSLHILYVYVYLYTYIHITYVVCNTEPIHRVLPNTAGVIWMLHKTACAVRGCCLRLHVSSRLSGLSLLRFSTNTFHIRPRATYTLSPSLDAMCSFYIFYYINASFDFPCLTRKV